MQEKVKKKVDEFFSGFSKIELPKGSIIIQPEEPLIYIYNLVSGYVKSYSLNDGGLELTINILKPYSFFPITETLSAKTNSYYFEAVTDVVLYKAPTHKVHDFLKSDPEVLFDLVKRISSGLEGFMLRTQYLVRSNSTQKVSSTFVLLARRFGETDKNKKVRILLPQTHADIANLAGVSRETASIEIKKLVDLGYIKVNKQIYTIENFERLRDLSTLYHEEKPLPFSF